MSEELSRVKSRRRTKTKAGRLEAEAPAVKVSASDETAGETLRASDTLSRKARHSAAAGKRTIVSSRRAAVEAGQGDDTTSRTKQRRMERVRLSKLFVNSLIFMFVALLASLFWWGWKGAPALDTLW
ncbi:hypothetical protein [Paenibacillus tengchongensis]|uniref:hypothetical protein n=1 Tax=Paenibacillus tengchongensis TaxID=2608684 RepID=UPI00124D6C88|nr:hypothetical protein [Paenibacillus tengchongensis]